MQIKGFYYKSKTGDISSLNTTNIDVPDAITSTQLNAVKTELQTNIDSKASAEAVSGVSDRITALEEAYTSENLDAKVTALETEQTEFKNNTTTLVGSITEKLETVKGENTHQDALLASVLPKTANITAILDRLNTLEGKVDLIRHANVEVIDLTAEVQTDDKGVTSKALSSEAEIIVKDIVTDTNKVSISAKAIELRSIVQTNNSMSLTAGGDVTIFGLESSGNLERSISNSQVSVQSGEYVKITNSSFLQNGYNKVEIGLSGAHIPPKNVLIDNCDFGNSNNNCVLIFGMQEDGVVTISNSHFGNASNCVRYSNRLNVKNVTFNFVNCVCDQWDTNPAWSGFMILQDYTSNTVEKEEENNLFAPEKVKINFINCTGPYGKINTENYGTDQAHYTGNSFTDEDGFKKQLVYMWNSKGKTVNYDQARYPVVTIA